MECRLHVDIFFLETELCHVEINHVEASIKWKRKKNVVIAIATATATPISITWRFFFSILICSLYFTDEFD